MLHGSVFSVPTPGMDWIKRVKLDKTEIHWTECVYKSHQAKMCKRYHCIFFFFFFHCIYFHSHRISTVKAHLSLSPWGLSLWMDLSPVKMHYQRSGLQFVFRASCCLQMERKVKKLLNQRSIHWVVRIRGHLNWTWNSTLHTAPLNIRIFLNSKWIVKSYWIPCINITSSK